MKLHLALFLLSLQVNPCLLARTVDVGKFASRRKLCHLGNVLRESCIWFILRRFRLSLRGKFLEFTQDNQKDTMNYGEN
jgi:hypothetical protein